MLCEAQQHHQCSLRLGWCNGADIMWTLQAVTRGRSFARNICGMRWGTEVGAAHRNVLWVLTAGGTYNTLNRYRMALIGLLAVATALEMWAANIALNLAGQRTLAHKLYQPLRVMQAST